VKNREIAGLLKRFENLRVMIIGDVMLDSYVWGKVTRISPEAPVPVVMQMNTENRLGGAANVALNIQSLGAVPVMCSVIGTDESGSMFKSIISNLNMTVEGLIESPKRITTNKTRIIAGNQQLLRVDKEIEQYIEKDLEEALWGKITAIINKKDISAIIFQDYDKGVITRNLIDKTIKLANSLGIVTLVDPKKRNFNLYHHTSLFKPNFKELTEGMNLDIKKTDYQKVHEAALKLQEKYGFKMVMITLSEQGMLISFDNTYKVVPAHTREVSDVSGAGDTVIAMASLCLATGTETHQMARLSNLAAGLVCEKVGVVPIEKDWLLNAGIDF
jgi:rfaE bifunctional protein kinase chain/domain